MWRNLVILLFMGLWIAVTAAGLLWGFRYDWPDFVHVDFGVPLTWATNTLSTFAGPADLWSVNIQNLLINLVFWMAIMVAAVALMLYKLKN